MNAEIDFEPAVWCGTCHRIAVMPKVHVCRPVDGTGTEASCPVS